MPGFHTTITPLVNGDPVEQNTLNKPLQELQDNALYLRELVESSLASPALFRRGVGLASGVLVGHAVYYDYTNSRYDRAVADGTAKENVVGVCLSKQNPTLGDLVTLGYVELDISAAAGGTVTAARYFLSATTPGGLTTTQPDPSVLVCLADGQGRVFVLPQIRDNPGHQGARGFRGYQGFYGLRGPQGVIRPHALTANGAAPNPSAAVFTAAGAEGLGGVLAVRNTGANGLAVSLALTSMFGDSATHAVTVAAGDGWVFDLNGTNAGLITPPYTAFTLSLAQAVPGSATTYQARGSVFS